MEEVLSYLSTNIKNKLLILLNKENLDNIEEIRLRAQRPIAIKTSNKIRILDHIVKTEELLETFQKVCEHSIYSYQKQICEGFITIRGGHRVGITGNCALENGKVININYISSLNFRIAREEKNCSEKIINYVLDEKQNILNTLIVSKPGCGKTTILRDLVRKISMKKTCGIVDERGEIASMYKGIPQNDIGILSDVLDNISKSEGMKMLIRSMAPEVIVCDEIGGKDDITAINYAICSGVKGIFTAHGNSMTELMLNNKLQELLNKHIIEVIIFLDENVRGHIKKIYKLDLEKGKYIVLN